MLCHIMNLAYKFNCIKKKKNLTKWHLQSNDARAFLRSIFPFQIHFALDFSLTRPKVIFNGYMKSVPLKFTRMSCRVYSVFIVAQPVTVT